MIHHEILQEIWQARGRGDFIYPYYGKYSIAEIGPTLLKRFGVPTSRAAFPEKFLQPQDSPNEKVVLFMVDGLGYDHFNKYWCELDFFNTLAEKGNVYPITSVFPSTTSAALTTIHTGLTPQEHGLPEWTVYFEEVDRIIQTIPFTFEPSQKRDSVMEIGGLPEMLYDGDTVYEQLRLAGKKVVSFMNFELIEGAYTRMTKKGAEIVGYTNGTDLMNKLKDALESQPGPGYYFVYWTQIDSVQHHFGPNSPEHVQQLKDFSFLASRMLKELDAQKAGDVTFLLTADHGQREIAKENILYLNDYLQLQDSYGKSKKGTLILPSGSPHDVFLSVAPEKLAATHDFLRRELDGKAEVILISQALKDGLFGLNQASEKFLRRIGNLLILPNAGSHVWYKYSQQDDYHFKGMHGGASEKEMIVPFAVLRLKDLV